MPARRATEIEARFTSARARADDTFREATRLHAAGMGPGTVDECLQRAVAAYAVASVEAPSMRLSLKMRRWRFTCSRLARLLREG